MPVSYVENLPVIMRVVNEKKPRTILDVGVGLGIVGLLIRGWCYWVERLDGVEVWEQYITQVQRGIYDNLFITDVRNLPLEDMPYDLILLIDVLEHFERDEGYRLLQRFNGDVLVSTPKLWFPQNDHPNPYEHHKSHWQSPQELAVLGYPYEDYSNDLSVIVLLKKRAL